MGARASSARAGGNTINYADCKFTAKRLIKTHKKHTHTQQRQKDKETLYSGNDKLEWDAIVCWAGASSSPVLHTSKWVCVCMSVVILRCTMGTRGARVLRHPECKHKRYLMSYVNFFFFFHFVEQKMCSVSSGGGGGKCKGHDANTLKYAAGEKRRTISDIIF